MLRYFIPIILFHNGLLPLAFFHMLLQNFSGEPLLSLKYFAASLSFFLTLLLMLYQYHHHGSTFFFFGQTIAYNNLQPNHISFLLAAASIISFILLFHIFLSFFIGGFLSILPCIASRSIFPDTCIQRTFYGFAVYYLLLSSFWSISIFVIFAVHRIRHTSVSTYRMLLAV